MNKFFYIPAGLQTPELEILMSLVQAAIDKGDKVTVGICSGGRGYACSFNAWSLPDICSACKDRTSRGLEKLVGNYTLVKTPEELNDFDRGYTKVEFSARELKNYTSFGVDIGQAVYSSYIGSTRDLELDGAVSVKVIRSLLRTSETLAEWYLGLAEKEEFSEVTLYNGRQNQYRPIFRLARQSNIPVTVYEYSGLTADCVYEFRNQLPQDLELLNCKIDEAWETVHCDKTAVAEYYYSFKRVGGAINDTKSFVNKQTREKIPENWDFNKKNVVIFNSSEDEFAALGGEYDDTIYPSQFEAISQIVSHFKTDSEINIWLRVHPNLKDVRWNFAIDLFRLERTNHNFHVVPGNSDVSSYAMLDKADLVVSFGSTIGIEAAYWTKPSILLGRCVYEKLGSCYVPRSHEEVINLISKVGSLEPLEKIGAYKAAVFWSKGGRSLEHFGGTRENGYTFKDHKLSIGRISTLRYLLAKAVQVYFFEKLINFGMRNVRKQDRKD